MFRKKEKPTAYAQQLAAEQALENTQAAGFRSSHVKEALIDAKPETVALHADRTIPDCTDVAPPLHVSTIFEENPDGYSYSRYDQPTRRRCEEVLGELEGGHCVTYASGSAALMAALAFYSPARVISAVGYLGSRRCMDQYRKQRDLKLISLQEAMEQRSFAKGDLVIVESPSNPTCLVHDLPLIVELAHAAGAVLLVDSTFASPVAIRPLACGADMVMHSSTKFLGGHSDLLAGALCTDQLTALRLKSERLYLGSPMGSLESFLLLRSLRTLHLRYRRQSSNALKVARWLVAQAEVATVWHPSLPSHPSHEVAARLLDHPPPCFAFEMHSEEAAMQLVRSLRLIHNVTSLGGVESTIDWRYKHDQTQPRTLLRISVGIEHHRDLINDLRQALPPSSSTEGENNQKKKKKKKKETKKPDKQEKTKEKASTSKR